MKRIVMALTDTVLRKYAEQKGIASGTRGEIAPEIDIPKTAQCGDLSVNSAFKLSRVCKKAPLAIATELKALYEAAIAADPACSAVIEKVEVAPPGFINFFFSLAMGNEILSRIRRESERYGATDHGHGEKVLIEFVSANPTGPLTIAHGRQACLGDSLAAIMRTCGYAVTKEFYLNDGGNQINILGRSVYARYRELCGQAVAFPEDGYQGDYIIDIAQKIKDENGDAFVDKIDDAETLQFFSRFSAGLILEGIKTDLAATTVFFDQYYPESSLYAEKIADVLAVLKKCGYTYEQEGALWFKSTDLGDEKDRVLIKSDGSYTYLVPDIAYHRDKFERGFTTLINLLGPDHHGYIARLKASVKALGYDPDHLEVIIVQLTTLYRNGEPFKMSTRKGTFISFRELIDEVGADAARLFFLLKLTDSQLAFDLELAKEKSQDNPVYYLQYAYARIASILRLADRPLPETVDATVLVTTEEQYLIKLLAEYPYVLITTAEQREPYRLVDYVRSVAAAFHKFYSVCRVIGDDEALSGARLCLVDCVRTVLKNAMGLLGVRSPERM